MLNLNSKGRIAHFELNENVNDGQTVVVCIDLSGTYGEERDSLVNSVRLNAEAVVEFGGTVYKGIVKGAIFELPNNISVRLTPCPSEVRFVIRTGVSACRNNGYVPSEFGRQGFPVKLQRSVQRKNRRDHEKRF